MKKIIIFLISTTIFAVQNSDSNSGEKFAEQEELRLTMQDFNKLLMQNHPLFEQIELENINTSLNKEIVNPFKGYNFNSQLNYYNNDGSNNLSNDYVQTKITNSINSKNKDGSNTSISHVLSKTGDFYNNNLILNHAIPLIKNKDGINDSLAYDIAAIEIKINTLNTNKQAIEFINNNLKKLINYKFMLDKIAILEQKAELKSTQLENTQKKFVENLVDKNEILLQQIGIKNNNLEIIQTKQQAKNLLVELQNLLNTNKNIIPEVELDKLYSIEQISQNFTNIQILKLTIEKLYRELESLKNEDREQIDLVLNGNLKGDNSTIGDAITNNGVSFGIGLNIALPLGKDIGANKITRKYNQIKIIEQQIQQANIDNKTIINNLDYNIKNYKNIIQTIKEQIKLSEENYLEYQELYENNNKELDFVLSSQEIVFSNKINLLEQLKNYQLLVLSYKNASL